jgi:hypothetical protein
MIGVEGREIAVEIGPSTRGFFVMRLSRGELCLRLRLLLVVAFSTNLF